jgi:hypothetical protein
MLIEAVYLFDAQALLERLGGPGVKIGIATRVISSLWDGAEVFPKQRNFTIPLSGEQREALGVFSANTWTVDGPRVRGSCAPIGAPPRRPPGAVEVVCS